MYLFIFKYHVPNTFTVLSSEGKYKLIACGDRLSASHLAPSKPIYEHGVNTLTRLLLYSAAGSAQEPEWNREAHLAEHTYFPSHCWINHFRCGTLRITAS